jgi:2-methylcitrate dehydratase
MHFKLGLYEHQSAGALQGAIDMMAANPGLLEDPSGGRIKAITITAYEPAFGIIGNPMKKDPRTRQSADHSMAYIVATLIRKALEYRASHGKLPSGGGANDAVWKALMLSPYDYKVDESAIFHPVARALMQKIDFRHGGPDYDRRYPDGIPTSIQITDDAGKTHDSGLVMYPGGHARNALGQDRIDLHDVLKQKFASLAGLASDDGPGLVKRLSGLQRKNAGEVASLMEFSLADRGKFD